MKTEFKGSKEKWGVSLGTCLIGVKIGERVFGVIDNVNNESKANALLISKAPELLQFLMDLVYDYENGSIEDLEDLVIKAEKLIQESTEINE